MEYELNISENSDDISEPDKDKLNRLGLTIFNAAMRGHGIIFVDILNSIENKLVRDYLINQNFIQEDGRSMTPLAAAASMGRTSIVKTLLSTYNVDIEKECAVRFDEHLVHGATPLWCATGAGHLFIVKLLVRHGANVNHKTKAQSTPLRAASFLGRLDIVQYLVKHGADVSMANAYNNTCIMIAAYKGHNDIVEFLLKCGADPNEQALMCGATALHFAAESDNKEICKLLLRYGATIKKNKLQLTPLLTAAERLNENVVEMFINEPKLFSIEEKIDALELMGASFANDKDNYNVQKAHKYLLIAMRLRYFATSSVIKKPFLPLVPAYDNWVESQTILELAAIRLNHNSIHMEALTIRERILGKNNPDLAHQIIYRGSIFADLGRFDRCECLWLYAMELRIKCDISIERDLLRFTQLYSQMFTTNVPLHLSNVLFVLSTAISQLELYKEKLDNPNTSSLELIKENEKNIITTLYLITLITRILKTSNEDFKAEELNRLHELIFRAIKLDARLRDGQSLLHLVVNGVTPVDNFHTNDVCRFPCYEATRLLLHCGASLSAVDCDRNTPLHTLAASCWQSPLLSNVHDEFIIYNLVEKIMLLFIEGGVHLDAVNQYGLKASDIAQIKSVKNMLRQHEDKHTTLECLSARCITRHQINYKGLVPKQLESFIEMHGADKLNSE